MSPLSGEVFGGHAALGAVGEDFGGLGDGAFVLFETVAVAVRAENGVAGNDGFAPFANLEPPRLGDDALRLFAPPKHVLVVAVHCIGQYYTPCRQFFQQVSNYLDRSNIRVGLQSTASVTVQDMRTALTSPDGQACQIET